MSPELVILVLALLVGCGSGGGVGSDNPPSVAGEYECLAGCSGVCDADPTMTVTQDGDQVAVTDSTGTATGTINNDGEYTVSNSICSCEGQIVDTIGRVSCVCDGIPCQEMTWRLM